MNCFRWTPGLLAAAALAGCDRGGAAAPPAPPSSDPGPRFLSAPTPTVAQRESDKAVRLAGRAAAGALVSLRNPDGEALAATAGSDGGWSLPIPTRAQPRLYALSSTGAGGPLKGEGALLVTPAPGAPALLLRAGAPSLTLAVPDGSLALQAVDFDSGGLSIAGLSDPTATLRLSVDGRPAAAGQADEKGRFAVLAVQADLKPGEHRLTLEDGTRIVEATVTTATGALNGAPYAVAPIRGGWRVDWSIPGGGVQSSLVFAPPLTAQR